MCIAVYKPAGVKAPTKEIFQRCFDKNDDGAGYMYAKDGYVHIRKGFMKFKDFWKSLKATLKTMDNDGDDIPFVYHFRITSQAGVSKGLTHPYPICSNYNSMKLERVKCTFGLAHNGIIMATSNWNVTDHNDTMEFIKEFAAPLIKNTKWYERKDVMGVFNYILSGNRVAILDKNGHCELLGKWIEDNGVYYSNEGFRKSGEVSGWKRLSDGTWVRECGYDGYDDYDDYDRWNRYYYSGKKTESKTDSTKKNSFEEDYPATEDTLPPLTYTQKQTLEKWGVADCENCGSPMILDYDTYDKSYYMYCPDCGMIHALTDNEAAMAISVLGDDDNSEGAYDD